MSISLAHGVPSPSVRKPNGWSGSGLPNGTVRFGHSLTFGGKSKDKKLDFLHPPDHDLARCPPHSQSLRNLLDLLVEGPGANVLSQKAELPVVKIVVKPALSPAEDVSTASGSLAWSPEHI